MILPSLERTIMGIHKNHGLQLWQVINEDMLSRLHIFKLGCLEIEIEIVYENQNRNLDINVFIPSLSI